MTRVKQTLLATILLSLLLPALTAASDDKCNVDKPCIIEALAPKIRFYDKDFNEKKVVKKRDYKKEIAAAGGMIATDGRKTIDGITLLQLKVDGADGVQFVEEMAFKLDPEAKIDCAAIAAATIKGATEESTIGVSVGLGESCKD